MKEPRTVFASEKIKVTKSNSTYFKWKASTRLSLYKDDSDFHHMLELSSHGKTRLEAMECLAKTMMRKTRDFMLTGEVTK